jgi:predicted MFS family arabinose efflux permease
MANVAPVGSVAVLRRARVATSLLFLLFGTTLGVWTARIPAIKEHLRLDDPRLSIALLAFAVGCIVGMTAVGRLVDRYGSRQVMVPAAFAEGLLLIPTAYMPSLLGLALALVLFGLIHGTLNIAMNANGIEVQRAYGRPIMSSFHAVYSIGGFVGAVAGGLFAWAGVGIAVTFISVGAAVVLLAVWATWWALPSEPAPAGLPATGAKQTNAGGLLRSRPVLFLGVLALCALVGEGAAADWSAVYLHDTLGSSPGFAAAGYAAFAIMMTAGRLVGDRLTARFGPVNLVRASAALAAAGLGAALLVSTPVAGVIGFGCLGAGVSCIAPQIFSAVGNRDPARAGQALAVVVSMGYAGFLLGPILIGSARTVVGLPTALAIPVVLALFVAVSATALRQPATLPSPEPGSRLTAGA